MTLSELPCSGSARIEAIGQTGAERIRLMDLGITPGTLVRKTLQSPLGDPFAFEVRGALIALRRSQTDRIEVTECL